MFNLVEPNQISVGKLGLIPDHSVGWGKETFSFTNPLITSRHFGISCDLV